MSDGKKYYCFCSSNCKYETMTKEQILAAIAQAVETGTVGDCDTGFITKVKEKNSGSYVSMWVGTQAQYNALPRVENNCMYIITDDTSAADLLATVEQTYELAQQAAETAGVAKYGSIVEFNDAEESLNDGGKCYVLYENGFAEAWYKLQAVSAKFPIERGGFYLTESIAIPHPQWLKDLLGTRVPIACDITPYSGDVTNDSFFVLNNTFPRSESVSTRSVQIACTSNIEQKLCIIVHYVFRWKEA